MINFEPETPEFGCLRTVLAYSAAVYVLATGLSLPSGDSPDFWVILFAPIIFPFVVVLAFAASGNSEVGPDAVGVAIGLLFFVAVFGLMLFLIRQSQKRVWVGWLLGSVVVGMLIVDYCKSS
jgi:hypothetical protein